jgi:replicative DNA helicase
MKLSREELEMQVLKHLTSDQKSVIRATALSINAEHFSYKEEGSKISYTNNLAKVVFKYFEESDGSLLTELVLENRMIAQGLSDVHKGRFLTLWAEIQDLDIDSNELHDLLMQLKQKRAISIWQDMITSGHKIMTETSLQEAVSYVNDSIKDIETELSNEPGEKRTLDIAESYDFFKREYEKQKMRPPGILSGYDEMDRRTSGFRGSQVTVVLGPSGGGKSLQLLNWAYNAHKQGKNVLYFSFELSLWDCLLRHMSLAFDVPFQELKRTGLMDEEVISLAEKLKGMQDGPYFEYDFTDSDPTPEYVDMRIRELTLTKGKPDIVIADYIGEMRTRTAPKTAKSWELHELAFDGLVKIARRHNLPVLTAQQLNRDTIKDSRKSKDSGKSHTYDQSAASGGQHIMHQAHYVFVLEPDKETGIAVVHMAKGRDAWVPPYCVRVAPEFNKIQELTPDEQIEMRAMKGLSQSEKPKTDDSRENTATRTQSYEDDGKLNVSINDESFSFNVDDLTIDDLSLGAPEW